MKCLLLGFSLTSFARSCRSGLTQSLKLCYGFLLKYCLNQTMAPDATTIGCSLTSFARSCRSGLTQSLTILFMHFYWSIDIMGLTLSRPAHGQYALTYAFGNAALISHGLHFVQAPLNTRIKKAPHFCEAL